MQYLCVTKKFGTKSHLNRHIAVVHEKVKNCKCKICGVGFGEKISLNTHITVVHGIPSYFKCYICNKVCSKNADLIKHINAVHSEVKNLKYA